MNKKEKSVGPRIYFRTGNVTQLGIGCSTGNSCGRKLDFRLAGHTTRMVSLASAETIIDASLMDK